MRGFTHGKFGTELGAVAQIDADIQVCGRIVGVGRRRGDGDRQGRTAGQLAVCIEGHTPDHCANHWRRCGGVVQFVVHVPVVGAVFDKVQVCLVGHALAVIYRDGGAIGGARRWRRGARSIGHTRIQVQADLGFGGFFGCNRCAQREVQRLHGARERFAAHWIDWVAHQPPVVVGQDVAVFVELEIARAAVGHGAIGLLDLEKAVAVDGYVQAVACECDAALGELLGNRIHLYANAVVVALRHAHGAGHHVGKFGARGLEADGAGVGNVVANHVQVLAGGVQAGESLLKTHGVLLLRCANV